MCIRHWLPSWKRKQLLEKTVRENDRLSISPRDWNQRYCAVWATKQRGLRNRRQTHAKTAAMCVWKRTKDWIKCKNLMDDDFIACIIILSGARKAQYLLFWHSMTSTIRWYTKDMWPWLKLSLSFDGAQWENHTSFLTTILRKWRCCMDWSATGRNGKIHAVYRTGRACGSRWYSA